MKHQHTHCPQCGYNLTSLEHDKRAVRWRFRIRLYDMVADDKSPQADTDPELDAETMGTWEAAGLRGVADAVIQVASAFHGTQTLKGLETETLAAKMPGLRPTLSRRGGNAVWRIPYDTLRTWDETGQRAAAWVARVDLERIPDEQETAPVAPIVFRRPRVAP